MRIKINPEILKGQVMVPASKSICHRAIICAGLSEGESIISNIMFSKDIEATCNAMKTLGVRIKKYDDKIKILGRSSLVAEEKNIKCNESGSTLRFMIPIAATLGQMITFSGKGKLIERPLDDYYKIFDEKNIAYRNNEGKLPLTIRGKLTPSEYKIRGDVSSQFITGLLFALPLLDGDSKIIVTTELESKGYVDLTIDMLNRFSVNVENRNYKEFIIKGNQKYKAINYEVEGDFSQVSFWLVAGLLGCDISCKGMNISSIQGDKAILDTIMAMRGEIEISNSYIKAISKETKGIVIDAKDIPDLVPILAVLASLSKGKTEIINASRLRFKESDRLKAISEELSKIGADIKETEDGLVINGVDSLKGGEVYSWNDHRIAMALAVASVRCKEPLTIDGAECVSKSYSDFWEHFEKLGGDICEWNMG
ncbi:3-phosphoshikimate 1-carboxyvinyltransferase [Clostridium cadaveris]|uniref:3-phosphoshikimate 1-carboxyvinyltransferase n=1 Tax=Clostridium cadaveris TaxID=1529 RepID=UPI0039A17C65